MKIFKKFSKLTSYVAILSLLSQMFVGVMPAFAATGLSLSAVPSTLNIKASSLVPETNGIPDYGNVDVDNAVFAVSPIAVTLNNNSLSSSEKVRITPIGAGPGIQLWAKDSKSNWYDINVTGWMDPAGVSIPAVYSAPTNVYAISDTPNTYNLTVNLAQLSNNTVVASTVGTINVATPLPIITSSTSGGFPKNVLSDSITPTDFSYTVDNTDAFGNSYTSLTYSFHIANTAASEIKVFNYIDSSNHVFPLTVTDDGSGGVDISNIPIDPSLSVGNYITDNFQVSFINPNQSLAKSYSLFFGVVNNSPFANTFISNSSAIFNVASSDILPPVGGALTMTTKLFPFGIVVTPDTNGVYAIHALSIDGADVFGSLKVVVTDDNMDTSITPDVLVDGVTNGKMVYSGGNIWNYDQLTSIPHFAAGQVHTLVSTFSDLAGNKTTLTAQFTTDATPPTATVAHNETDKTITYTFNEPVQLMDSSNVIVPPADYALKLGIYNLTDYASHTPGTPAPATNGTITNAVLSGDAKSLVITYTGSLIQKADTNYIVDAWGYNITDLAGNKMLADSSTQSFTVLGDSIPPTATVAHNETNKTITYTFSEPVVLRDALGVILPSTTYASSLAVYESNAYLTHVPGVEPAHAVTISSAVLSPDAKTIVITYTGSLIKNVDTSYIVDAWGKNITDLVGNKMAQSDSQIFKVTGDTTAPVLTMLGSSPIQVTVGSAYTDAGATALDAVDGNLTSAIKTTNIVDTSKIGSYTVTYNVTDSAGNTASTARIVNVVAVEAPVVVAASTGSSTNTTGSTASATDTTIVADTGTGTPEVKGTSTTNNTDTKSDPGFFGSTWMGIYDWIWILIAIGVIGGGAWWLFGMRRQD